MADSDTYTGTPIEGEVVCKRCKREYPYPQAGERPIRCECGWWYFNDGVSIREALPAAHRTVSHATRISCTLFEPTL